MLMSHGWNKIWYKCQSQLILIDVFFFCQILPPKVCGFGKITKHKTKTAIKNLS